MKKFLWVTVLLAAAALAHEVLLAVSVERHLAAGLLAGQLTAQNVLGPTLLLACRLVCAFVLPTGLVFGLTRRAVRWALSRRG
jgi:hypothetical protein